MGKPLSFPASPRPLSRVALARLQRHLGAFASDVDGVRSAVIASVDGFALAQVPGPSGAAERLAAMTSSMLALGSAIGRELALGHLEVLMIETMHGKVLMRAIPADPTLLLMAACDQRAVVGNVLWRAKSCAAAIQDELAR